MRRRQNQTGAGVSSDDEGEQTDDESEPSVEEQLENRVQDNLAQNIRHAPVKVAKHRSPFIDEQLEDHFITLLRDVLSEAEDVPQGYGILADKWEDEDYPEVEVIRPGTRGKELRVILPHAEWFGRAVQWGQGLQLMSRVLEEFAEESSNASNSDSD